MAMISVRFDNPTDDAYIPGFNGADCLVDPVFDKAPRKNLF